MSVVAGEGGWTLRVATEDHLEQLMGWFADAHSVNVWGGPKFRYPYTTATFRKDSHWDRMARFTLESPDNQFAAFGQIYERYRRINLARLVVHPELRGQGVGRRLVERLLEVGPSVVDRAEFSLFVYRDNTPTRMLPASRVPDSRLPEGCANGRRLLLPDAAGVGTESTVTA